MAQNKRTFRIFLKRWQATVVEVEARRLEEAKDAAPAWYDEHPEELEWGDEDNLEIEDADEMATRVEQK